MKQWILENDNDGDLGKVSEDDDKEIAKNLLRWSTIWLTRNPEDDEIEEEAIIICTIFNISINNFVWIYIRIFLRIITLCC